jgi:predicted signal transduction protein with EAL and GGDEF domain
VQSFLSCRPLSGIKIDKEAFWRLRATPALRQLVSLCFQLAGKVLIEGIETERDRTWALQAGADFGQILLAVLDMAGGLKRHFQEGDHANDSAPLPAAAYRK